MSTDTKTAENHADHYFGVCPECHDTDGYINVGRGHWFYCGEHRIRWFAGSNLFSSWRDQTEDEQRKQYDELDFGGFTEISSSEAHCPDCCPAPERPRDFVETPCDDGLPF